MLILASRPRQLPQLPPPTQSPPRCLTARPVTPTGLRATRPQRQLMVHPLELRITHQPMRTPKMIPRKVQRLPDKIGRLLPRAEDRTAPVGPQPPPARRRTVTETSQRPRQRSRRPRMLIRTPTGPSATTSWVSTTLKLTSI